VSCINSVWSNSELRNVKPLRNALSWGNSDRSVKLDSHHFVVPFWRAQWICTFEVPAQCRRTCSEHIEHRPLVLILNVQQGYKSTSIMPFPLIYRHTWPHPMAQADNDKVSAKGGGNAGSLQKYIYIYIYFNWLFRTFQGMKAKALSGQNITLNDTKSSHSFQYLTSIFSCVFFSQISCDYFRLPTAFSPCVQVTTYPLHEVVRVLEGYNLANWRVWV